MADGVVSPLGNNPFNPIAGTTRLRVNGALARKKMHIFLTRGCGDPMLLDTRAGLRAIHAELRKFLNSSYLSAAFPAAVDGSPEPFAEFLRGLRVAKTAGQLRLMLGSDGWLQLEGTVEELDKCATQFLIAEQDGHTHLYTKPVSLIIEADSVWNAGLES